MDALLVHDGADDERVVGAAHEGEGDHVEARAEGPAQILLVLLGEGGGRDGDAREVEPLVVGDHAADHDLGDDAGALHGGGLKDQAAVVDEDRVTGAHVAGQALVGRGDQVAVAGDVLGGDREDVAEAEAHRALGETAYTDLGALQVGEDADRHSQLGRGLPDPAVDLLVELVAPVAEVEPRHVHTGGDQLAQALRRRGGGPQCADNLRSTTHKSYPNWYRPLDDDEVHSAWRNPGDVSTPSGDPGHVAAGRTMPETRATTNATGRSRSIFVCVWLPG